jgi:hypothetical protein
MSIRLTPQISYVLQSDCSASRALASLPSLRWPRIEIPLLEREGERLGERGVGNAAQGPVVDCIEREDLLDAVPQLVHRDVEGLVAHAIVRPRAEVGLIPATRGSHGVPRPARGSTT